MHNVIAPFVPGSGGAITFTCTWLLTLWQGGGTVIVYV